MNAPSTPLVTDEASYHLAQSAMADLKAAIVSVLGSGPADGLSNAAIGRSLGIYGGHQGHEGHISRTLLHLLQQEGVVEQDESSKRWRLKAHTDSGE